VTVLGVDCCACVAIGHAERAPKKRDEFPPLHCQSRIELSPSLSDLSVKVQAAGCPPGVNRNELRCHICFPPDSDRTVDIAGGPFRARTRLMHHSKAGMLLDHAGWRLKQGWWNFGRERLGSLEVDDEVRTRSAIPLGDRRAWLPSILCPLSNRQLDKHQPAGPGDARVGHHNLLTVHVLRDVGLPRQSRRGARLLNLG